MSTLRLAVVGVGAYENSRARGYLATIQKLGHLYDLCALCDRGGEALKTAGNLYGVDALYTNVETMLREQKPDALFVLVPTDGQTVVALAGVKHNCHILTEIPYALTLAFGDAIDEACRAKGLKWEIAENVWLWPSEQLKQKVVARGLLGKLTHARLSYPAGSYHGLNAVRMILNSTPRRALGYARAVQVPPYENYGGGRETTRWAESGVIEFDNDVACLYEMPPVPGVRRGLHWEIEGWNGYLQGNELVLTEGGKSHSYPIREIHEEINGEKVLAAVRVDTDEPVVWENPYKQYGVTGQDDIAKAAILESLHRAVTQNTEPQYGVPGGRIDYEMWIALRESAERGSAWVDLPLADPTGLEDQIREEYIRAYGGHPVEDADKLLNASFGRLSAMWTVAGWL